jgi:drug/metabolite transporter (DMT)-like permease
VIILINNFNNESRGMFLGILAVVTFGLTLPATRYVVDYLDPMFIGTGRAVFAALAAIPILIFYRAPLPNCRQFLLLIIASLGVVIGFPILSAIAMQSVPASHGGVIFGLSPLITAVIGSLINRERPSVGFWISGLIGSICVVGFALSEGAGSLVRGDWFLLGAVLLGAMGYAVSGLLSKELGGWQVICWCLVITLPFTFIPASQYAPTSISHFPTSVWVGFVYLGLVSQLSGFFCGIGLWLWEA